VSTLTVDLPLHLTPERARLLLAVRLFEEGEVSLGYAAEMAEYSVRTFTELLGKRGIPVAAYPESDLDQEMEAFERLDSPEAQG